MKPTQNYIFFTVEKEFEDKITSPSGALTLDLMSFDTVVVDKDDNVVYNNLEKRRIYGEVVGVPDRLNFNPDNPILLRQEDEGLPLPQRYVPHEMVAKFGPECMPYDPSLWEPKYKNISDIPTDVKVGDKIYFHYNSLEEENRVKLDNGESVYKLSYQSALCVVRDGEIIAVSGHVLVSPIYDTDIIDLGQGLKGRVTKSGIITETDMKYVDIVDEDGVNRQIKTRNGVKHRYLEGVVAYICNPLKGDDIEFKIGDKILYKKYSDWKITVEGKEYFCIKYWDIEAKFELKINE